MAAHLLTLLLTVTLATQSSDAVRCYRCNSIENPACRDPFNDIAANRLAQCQGRYCVMFKAKANGQKMVERVCTMGEIFQGQIVEDHCVVFKSKHVTSRSCVCSSDFCNAAVGLYATALWAAGAAAVALYVVCR